MSGRRGYRRVFRLPGRRGRVASDVDEELAYHLDRLVEDLVADGWDREEARREAVRRFGDVDAVGRSCRRIGRRREGERTMGAWVEMVRQDVGFALRQLLRRPLAGALAVATVALGVGATAVVYAVVDAVVLSPLPFERPEELVRIRTVTPQGRAFSTSEPIYLDLRERQRSFTDVAARGWRSYTLAGDGEVESLAGMRVTHTLLPLLGIEPLLGRGFRPGEDVAGGDDRVVMISEGLWLRRFGADPDVLGRTLEIDGEPHRVVGVVPSGRAWPGTDLFVPLSPEPVDDRENMIVEVTGRLKPGVALDAARRDVERIMAELSAEYPESIDGWSGTVFTEREWAIGDRLSRLGDFLLAAVALLLLMACASVSNLQITRATARLQEMGVRAALGAGRRRIVGQLLSEGLLLALLGCAAGLLLAWLALPLARALGPADVARLSEATLDGGVLVVALAASVLTVVAAGLAPAFLVARGGLFDALRAGPAHAQAGGRRLRDALVAVQFALAVVVVLGAALMARSYAHLQRVDLGFEPEGLVRFAVGLPESRFDGEERMVFVARLEDALRALPGVRAVGVTPVPAFSSMRPSNFVASSEREPDRQEDFTPVSWRAVTGGYFAAAGIPFLAGRTFTRADRPPEDADFDEIDLPIVLDARLAEELFPDEDPIGRQVTWFQPGGFRMRVVGVVGAARDEYVNGPPRPRIYLPFSFAPWTEPTVLVRAAGDPAALVPAIRRTVGALDPGVPVIDATPVRTDLRETVAWPRFTTTLLAAFGSLAMLLAGLGIYGVTAFAVERRRREIGVRVALGAAPSRVLGMVLRRSIRLAAVGIAGGVALALVGSGLLETLLYGVAPHDPATFVVVPALLAVLAVVAAWVPARRAAGVDPRRALTAE